MFIFQEPSKTTQEDQGLSCSILECTNFQNGACLYGVNREAFSLSNIEILKTWILLNKDSLNNIRAGTDMMVVHCSTGTSHIILVGHVPLLQQDFIWFH